MWPRHQTSRPRPRPIHQRSRPRPRPRHWKPASRRLEARHCLEASHHWCNYEHAMPSGTRPLRSMMRATTAVVHAKQCSNTVEHRHFFLNKNYSPALYCVLHHFCISSSAVIFGVYYAAKYVLFSSKCTKMPLCAGLCAGLLGPAGRSYSVPQP